MGVQVNLHHVEPTREELRNCDTREQDQIERSFYLTLSNPTGGEIALAKVKVVIVDHLGLNKIHYLPQVCAISKGRFTEDLRIQVVRTGTDVNKGCVVPYQIGDIKDTVEFPPNVTSVFINIPARIIDQFADDGQCHLTFISC